MSIVRKIRRAVRGDVSPNIIALELLRRAALPLRRHRNRKIVERSAGQPATLTTEFAKMEGAELLAHFQNRNQPHFFPGFSTPLTEIAKLYPTFFPEESKELIDNADRIVNDRSWPLLGFGEKRFGPQPDWNRDLLSGRVWPLDYHAQITVFRNDGSDIRVLWELNRLSHLLTLAQAYALTGDERFTVDFFQQVESWQANNPCGRGANWNCAMEVALRAMNLLGAFEIFRHSPKRTSENLQLLLAVLDQHGTFIRQNLEFSYLTTSNHYLSDVVGLLWLGIMLPELSSADSWREFGLREMLREMDKQVLPDGADFESSTGYHRFVLELFLYSFVLCRANAVEIPNRYWEKLEKMIDYSRAYLRPDGRAPLIGDSDSGQVLTTRRRNADDHAYILAVGAAIFDQSRFKLANLPAPPEVFWIAGEKGMKSYQSLARAEAPMSKHFPDAGQCILRDQDLYLLLNASGAGIGGRGSHGHNDALSIEVSACGRGFIVDPGTYVYTADLEERHRFRSTSYHSTVQVDNAEQNIIEVDQAFVIGSQARARTLMFEAGPQIDRASAEHYAYTTLKQPVTHRRTVTFHKPDRWWLVEDEFSGRGEHDFVARFHFDNGLEVMPVDTGHALGWDKMSGAKLLICPVDLKQKPEFEAQFTSRDYGLKVPSKTASWHVRSSVPLRLRWALIPVSHDETQEERLLLLSSLK